MTIKNAFDAGVEHLRARDGVSEARVVMRAVLDSITGVRNASLMQPNQALTDDQSSYWAVLLNELVHGRPLPYVLGSIEFCGHELRCDERALIPRPETELLVATVLDRLQNISCPRVADLGTGTGCIAVSIAHARTDSQVYGTDLSRKALQLARENASRLAVAERIDFLRGAANEWVSPIKPFAPFDAILSNPPYIESAEIERLQPQVQREPRLALDGGADGLDPYRALAAQCAPVLKTDGFVACELGAGQFAAVRAIFEAQSWKVDEAIRDFAGHERVLCAHR